MIHISRSAVGAAVVSAVLAAPVVLRAACQPSDYTPSVVITISWNARSKTSVAPPEACLKEGGKVTFQAAGNADFIVIFKRDNPFKGNHRFHAKGFYDKDDIDTQHKGGSFDYTACYYPATAAESCLDPKIIVEPVSMIALTISEFVVDFGEPRHESQRKVAITNGGNTPLHIDEITKLRIGPFRVEPKECERTLAPGESCTVTITFRPAEKPSSDRILVKYHENQQAIIVKGGGR